MSEPADIVLTLPFPPSVNAIWRSVGGRVLKSKDYRTWQRKAGWSVAQQIAGDAITGLYRMRLTVPKTKHDIFNLEKAVSDLLQEMRVIRDDSDCEEGTIRRDRARAAGTVMVELWALPSPTKPTLRMAAPAEPLRR